MIRTVAAAALLVLAIVGCAGATSAPCSPPRRDASPRLIPRAPAPVESDVRFAVRQ